MAAIPHLTCLDCEEALKSLHHTKFTSNYPESPFLEEQVLDIIAFYDAHNSQHNGTIHHPGSSLTICPVTCPSALEAAANLSSPTAYYFSAGKPDCPFVEAQVINDIKDFEVHVGMKPSDLCFYSTKVQLAFLKQQRLFQPGSELEGTDVPSDDESYLSYVSDDARASERSELFRQHLAYMSHFPSHDKV